MFDREERLADGSGRSAAESPPSRAILLCGEKPSPAERNLATLLDFFGIPWKASCPSELAEESANKRDTPGGYCVLTAAPSLAEALQSITALDSTLPPWLLNASSLYIFGFQETPLCLGLLSYLTSARDAGIQKSPVPEARVSVTSDLPDLCGPMAGLQVPVKMAEKDSCFGFPTKNDGWRSIIATTCGEIFVSAIRDGVPIFLSVVSETIDINAPATKFFDVKEYFASAVPAVMYLKWAFARICGNGAVTRGCLIVDDLPLKSSYGFLHFPDALRLMDSHNFVMSIAFIPWNWQRTDSKAVRMFQQRADRLSLCVHGCDHTASEFGARSTALLNRKIKTAMQRMEGLSQATSLHHDQVMVFPQGAFSPEAGRALKLNGFVAAVNTEVAPSEGAQNDTLVSDVWNIAIMKYGSFPIFTRRYLTHGVENFAFDALLGKPCLMVAHHEVFKRGGRELMEFIGKLNSLNWKLHWCSAGEVVNHSFKCCQNSGGMQSVQMFSEQLVLENQSVEPSEFVVMKHLDDSDSVSEVLINQKPADHSRQENQLRFKLTVPPGKKAEIQVTYFDNLDLDPSSDRLIYRLKTRARRHLSEFRDNYVSQNDFLYATAARVKRFLS